MMRRAIVLALLISSVILTINWWARQSRKTVTPHGRDIGAVEARPSASSPAEPSQTAAPNSGSPLKPLAAEPNETKEHTFRGMEDKADASARTLTVNGESVR